MIHAKIPTAAIVTMNAINPSVPNFWKATIAEKKIHADTGQTIQSIIIAVVAHIANPLLMPRRIKAFPIDLIIRYSPQLND